MPKDKAIHIGIFGRRNTGKSTLINLLAGQEIAIVSDQAGTTTDPVKKSIEIKGLGAVVLIDTAGIDDVGELGRKRIEKSEEIIKQIDIAILIWTHHNWGNFEEVLIKEFQNFDIPYLLIHSKKDICPLTAELQKKYPETIEISTFHHQSLDLVITALQKKTENLNPAHKSMLKGVIFENQKILLVTPIDTGAPEGRLILPQVQLIRDILDNKAIAITCQPEQIANCLQTFTPDLVITDSQVFDIVNKSIPQNIPLTSFSVILARHKGAFEKYLMGTKTIADLKDGDKVLILESCSHHASCEDIGRIKLPKMLLGFTQKQLEFTIVAGLSPIPDAIHEYALVIQCGGCVITKKQLHNRLKPAIEADIPVSNYGLTIAYINGIFDRSIEIFN